MEIRLLAAFLAPPFLPLLTIGKQKHIKPHETHSMEKQMMENLNIALVLGLLLKGQVILGT